MKYQKKPTIVEALQYTGKNLDELRQWADDQNCPHEEIRAKNWRLPEAEGGAILMIVPTSGVMPCYASDMVIYEPEKGFFYPMPVEIFNDRYEPSDGNKPVRGLHIEDSPRQPILLLGQTGEA